MCKFITDVIYVLQPLDDFSCIVISSYNVTYAAFPLQELSAGTRDFWRYLVCFHTIDQVLN